MWFRPLPCGAPMGEKAGQKETGGLPGLSDQGAVLPPEKDQVLLSGRAPCTAGEKFICPLNKKACINNFAWHKNLSIDKLEERVHLRIPLKSACNLGKPVIRYEMSERQQFNMREWLSWWSTTLPRSGSRVRVPSRALNDTKKDIRGGYPFFVRSKPNKVLGRRTKWCFAAKKNCL